MTASVSVHSMQDSFTCLAEPDETLAAFGEVPKMRKRACCEAECEECGLEVTCMRGSCVLGKCCLHCI